MPFLFPEGQRFDCGSCTKCCRGAWNVHVDPSSYEQVVGSDLYHALEQKHGKPPMYMDQVEDGEKTALALLDRGHCVFLQPDKLCAIHKHLGIKAKPLGCRQFPFILRPTPDGVVVGVSFFCSAVQSNSGRPLEAHAPELEGLLKEYRHVGVGHRPLSYFGELTVSWEAYKLIEGSAQAAIASGTLRDGLWLMLLGTALGAAWLLVPEADAAQTRAPRLASAITPSVSDDEFDRRLRAMPVIAVPRDDVFASLEQMFVIGILGALESPTPALCKTNTEAIFMRQTFDSETFRCDVDLSGFDAWRRTFDAAWCDAPFRRFMEHLLFRKFLAIGRSIVANAAGLYLTLSLLEFYRDLSAFIQGKAAPAMDDVHIAFDVVERGFTTHTRAMDPFFNEMGRIFLKQVQQVPLLKAGSIHT